MSVFFRVFVGITPAWAGKSRAALSPKNCSRDHPRVGGEKRLLLGAGCKGLGSPPRGRGKAQPQLPAGTRKRITPAWAGKSCTALRHCFRCGDHPRVGGEKFLMLLRVAGDRGSPPRGRGKDIVVKGHSSKEGITPAWAGKSRRKTHNGAKARDHPRVGGEKALPSNPL